MNGQLSPQMVGLPILNQLFGPSRQEIGGTLAGPEKNKGLLDADTFRD